MSYPGRKFGNGCWFQNFLLTHIVPHYGSMVYGATPSPAGVKHIRVTGKKYSTALLYKWALDCVCEDHIWSRDVWA
jgi:hypothetical protein